MLFNSGVFAIFLLITFVLYYLPVMRKVQIEFLVVASFVFYSWTAPELLILLSVSIFLNAVVSWKVSRLDGRSQWKWALAGVVINLGVLAWFKYAGLLGGLIGDLTNSRGAPAIAAMMAIPLPIGISFYTFEGISLLLDAIARRRRESESPEKLGPQIVADSFGAHVRNTSLFVAFFPHLIAGPILKARHFIPQIQIKHFRDIDWDAAGRALVVGFFLKMVLADNLKDQTLWIANPFYTTLSMKTGLVLLVGYSMQIFADFAGYSLIAIGLGFLFGYEMPPNFNFPYISRSFSEFWRRWHISLSTWLRDYLYFPLGGNRKGRFRTYINLATVMVLGGLWHGAAWSYAIWGAYHGLALAIERFVSGEKDLDAPSPLWASTLRVLFVYTVVTLGWLLFKLPNFSEVIEFGQSLLKNKSQPFDMVKVAPVVIFSVPVVVYHLLYTRRAIAFRQAWAARNPVQFRRVTGLAYGLLLAAIMLNYGSGEEFIYFQF